MFTSKLDKLKPFKHGQALILAVDQALRDAMPQPAVAKALGQLPDYQGRLYLLAVGKAAWSMAEAGVEILGEKLTRGLVITKYGHSRGPIQHCDIYEAGHPLPDQNSIKATQKAIELADRLEEGDLLVFLLSGGGSALFEAPYIPLEDLQEVNRQLLASGADIVSVNTIRKRLSRVKAGRFAERCQPAQIYSVILSDVLGDPLDSIASGPTAPDSWTAGDALRLVEDWNLKFSDEILALLKKETPKKLDNVKTVVSGSVSQLCRSAAKVLSQYGYETSILTDRLDCEAAEAGRFLGAIARSWSTQKRDQYGTAKDRNGDQSLGRGKRAFILGGETSVTLKGKGLGGRNQELVLAAAPYLKESPDTLLISLGSDGTDGPTDAAGAFATPETIKKLEEAGISWQQALANNDSYHAFQAIDGLIITGPTGTNVNDLTILLMGDEG